MDKNLNLQHLKGRPFLTFTLLFIYSQGVYSQQLNKIKSLDLVSSPQNVSIDRQGSFYVASKQGIHKYDSQGNLSYQFSPVKNSAVTLIEAWQGLKTFIYLQDFQEYFFLDRFLNASERYLIPLSISSFSSLATVAGDDNLWLIDNQQLSLKKIELPSYNVILDVPINRYVSTGSFNLSHIREYQNKLFINDPNQGIFVFDKFGSFVEKLEVKHVDYFSFADNELLFYQKGKAILIDIYTKKKREIELPDLSYKFVLMIKDRLICFSESKVDLYLITN